MKDLYKVDLTKNKIKWHHKIWLWLFPTVTVLEGDSVHYFKMAFGKIYYVGERFE